MCDEKFVSYLRVSTQKQGRSGLGEEAQRAAVQSFVHGRGDRIVKEFVEIESGKNNERPKLQDALRLCRLIGARLVIAKLDRLSRNAAFLFNLKDSGAKITCCDMPDANEMTIGIMAVIAQGEGEAISRRTKEALVAAKARGQRLGGLRAGHVALDAEKAAKGLAKRRRMAAEKAADLGPVIREIEAEGMTSDRAVAEELNRRGIVTARGGKWHGATVKAVRKTA